MNNQGRQVSREELEEFRIPTHEESRAIQKYLLREITVERRLQIIGAIISGVFGFGIILSVVVSFQEYTFVQILILLGMGILSLFLFGVACKGLYIKKKLKATVSQMNYFVMDCKAYNADLSVDRVGEGIVWVYNEFGQYCKNGFVIDQESASICKRDKQLKFLLLKCPYGNRKQEYYFELFSEKKLAKFK